MGIETLKIYLSNKDDTVGSTDATLSYGGILTTTEVTSQTISPAVNEHGVEVKHGHGNATSSAGTLVYTAATQSLKWLAPGEAYYGPEVPVYNGGAGASYAIRGINPTSGYLVVDITPGSLSGSNNYTWNLTSSTDSVKIFDDVTKDEAYVGQTDYRCLYIKNTSASTARSIVLYLDVDTPGVDTLAVRGPAASVNTAETQSITGPGGTFYAASAPVSIGDIPAGQYWGFWIRRTVAALTTDGVAANTFTIRLAALV